MKPSHRNSLKGIPPFFKHKALNRPQMLPHCGVANSSPSSLLRLLLGFALPEGSQPASSCFDHFFAYPCPLDDHLCNALSTQSLATLESLTLETSERVEDGSEHQDHSSRDQASHPCGDASPLHSAHGGVQSGAQEVGLKLANKSIELGRSGTDSQEQRNFEEEDDGRVYSTGTLKHVCDGLPLYSQAHDTKRNDPIGVEKVRDSKCEAEEYADHASPALMLALPDHLASPHRFLNIVHICPHGSVEG